ncbi:MAG: hypothetical protein ACFFBS_08160 [Promethearchaeota archaeon]
MNDFRKYRFRMSASRARFQNIGTTQHEAKEFSIGQLLGGE